MLKGSRPYLPAHLRIDDKGLERFVPFLRRSCQEAIASRCDTFPVDLGGTGNARDLKQGGLVVFQITFAFREDIDFEWDQVDVHSSNLSRQQGPIEERSGFDSPP